MTLSEALAIWDAAPFNKQAGMKEILEAARLMESSLVTTDGKRQVLIDTIDLEAAYPALMHFREWLLESDGEITDHDLFHTARAVVEMAHGIPQQHSEPDLTV